MIPVIFDTDIGTDIDDTWPLAMALRCPEIDIRLVTTVSGDPEYRARIVARLLKTAGRDDIPIGIGLAGRGNEGSPQGRYAAGGDLDAHRPGVSPDGVSSIVTCIMESDQAVTVLSIGPATNIAAALAAEPAIATRARFVGMHGSVRIGHRGAAGAVPEYNVQSDVNAFRRVIAAPWNVLLTPLDTCGTVLLKGDRYQQILSTTDPLMTDVLECYREWASMLGVDWPERRTSTLYDCVAVYLAYDTELVDIEHLPIAVDDDGTLRVVDGAPNLSVATSWRDQEAYLRECEVVVEEHGTHSSLRRGGAHRTLRRGAVHGRRRGCGRPSRELCLPRDRLSRLIPAAGASGDRVVEMRC